MALKFVNQTSQGNRILSIVPPFHPGTKRLDSYGDVRGNDHELIGGVAIVKLLLKPGITGRVQTAMPMNVAAAILFTLGSVEHDHLDRYGRFRHEAIARKTCRCAGVDQVKTVTDRFGSSRKIFVDPLRSQK